MFKEKSSSIQKCVFVLILLLVFMYNAQLLAQPGVSLSNPQKGADEPEDVFGMPIEELMEIEVVSSATLTETKPRLVPSAVTTITQEDIWSSGARSLYELLDIYVPNLEWLRHHYEADVMGLRGIIGDRNDKYLLLVNGRIMNHRTHAGALSEQDLVMLSDIHHIDIVRGPGSALYGPGAVSMVINIVTYSSETFQGTEITSRLGAVEEFYSTEIKHGQKFKDDDGGFFIYAGVGKYVGASKYDAPQIYPFTFPTRTISRWTPGYTGPPAGSLPGDGIRKGEPATNKGVIRDGAATKGRPPIKLYAQIKKGGWDFWVRYTRGGKHFAWHTQSIARPRWGNAEAYFGRTGALLPWHPNYYGYQQITGYIGYKQELTKDIDVDYAFSYDMFDFERFIQNGLNDASREDQYHGKALLKWQPNDKHRIAVGTELSHMELGWKSPSRDDVDPPLSSQVNPVRRWSTNMRSFLGEWQWNISDQWTTFIGARLDEHTYTARMFSPRAAIVHTPNKRDTYKFMWSRSVRANFEENMRAQSIAHGGESDPEKLDNIELRYERQQSKNLDLAASIFVHYNLQAIAWSGTQSDISGTQREYGIEFEADYHTDKTRVHLSHGYTKLYSYYLSPGQGTVITAEPYGYGDDLTNWSNHITKLTAQHKLDDKLTFDASLRIYWAFPGMKDYDEYYPYTSLGAISINTVDWSGTFPIIDNGWERAYRGSYFLDLGLNYKYSENLSINVTGYNLLGILDKDFNKRNYVCTGDGNGDFRSHAPAVGVSLLYKF